MENITGATIIFAVSMLCIIGCGEFSGYDVEVYLHNNYNWYFYVGVRTNICLDVRQ